MSITLRWFKIEPFKIKDLQRLKDELLLEKYNDRRGWGFVLNDVRVDHITGRFIVREKKSESFRNPNGETQVVEFQTFSEVEFRIATSSPQIEILSSIRGAQEMFNHFSSMLDFRIRIEPLQLDPIKWLKVLKNDYGAVLIKKAVISDIELSVNVAASVTVVGTEDVQKFFKEIVKSKKYKLDSAVISFFDNEFEVKIDILRSGRLKLLTSSEDYSASFFRSYVKQIG